MKKNFKNRTLVYGAFVATVFVVGCLTINVYFPAEAVQEAANAFVEDVQEGAGEDATTEPVNTEEGSPKEGFLRINWISQAYAEGEDAINISTPESKRLKASMKKRNAEITSLKKKGAIGESNKGLLVERDAKALALPERAKAKKTLAAENSDRMNLYKEIVRANNYPQSKLGEIQKIFAKSWQSAAPGGSWVQKGDGSWVKK